MKLRNASNGTYSVVALAMTKGDLPGRLTGLSKDSPR